MLRRPIQLVLLYLCVFHVAAPVSAQEVLYPNQGWTDDERIQFYFTTQGSQLVPYTWFLALEQSADDELFRSDVHMARLGFVLHPGDKQRNPDALPVGFVKDDNPHTVHDHAAKRSFLSGKSLPPTNAWLGFTCAACHTSQLEHEGKTYRVDGGPALADIELFLQELVAAVDATLKDPEKMTRFARRVLTDTGYNETEERALFDRVKSYSQVLHKLVSRSKGQHRYGYGRLDAFGAILNEVCETSLEVPDNHFPADAPASYPCLWDTPRLDWVQWNGSIGNPMARNVGEVLGVFGQFRLLPEPPAEQFRSTAHIAKLFELEQHVAKLRAPPWPFGDLDPEKVALGKRIYARNCIKCHSVADDNGNYPSAKIGGREYIRTTLIPVNEIGTDPALADNFVKRLVRPGVLAGRLEPPLAQLEKVPRPVLLSLAVKGVIGRYVAENRLTADQIAEITGHRPAGEQAPKPWSYKARPLNGVWATAPYLHNGSIPNLYELLLPAARRSKSFMVGSRRYDSKRVGFVTASPGCGTEFNVDLPGNSNRGHEGHGPGENLGYTETFENGVWREFTDDERWALVEYMKSLGSNPVVEHVPDDEAMHIGDIVAATIQQLKNRYPDQKQVRRAVHAKDHGCVKALFEVHANLDPALRVGVFAEPGRRYDAWIRFSNAATLVLPDDPRDRSGKPVPGSRGMAIKLMGVKGTPLSPPHGALTQDFLLVNHPVFAFANVEDYQVLSRVIADPANQEQPDKFFAIQFAKEGLAAARAKATLQIVGRIRAADVAGGAYQPQPASPVDCRYFSGAPFLFGPGYVMKYSAAPRDAPPDPKPNVADPNYLRNALIERLAVRKGARPVVFDFQVQRRPIGNLDVLHDIENASTEWPEGEFPFVSVATITIPPQDFDSPARRALCENLFFTPWHGITEHRPLGGINRLRRSVYEASSGFRHLPKEP